MSKLDNILGKKYNNLTVVGREENSKNGEARWKCRCDCGQYTIVSGGNLKSGSVKSCGCLKHKKSWNSYIKEESRRLYSIWCGIKQRCYNEKSPSYKNYGGRGIELCDEWKNFSNFEKWSFENGYFDSATIERNDVNKNYCPENCSWILLGEQAKNRRTSYNIIYNGENLNLMDFCRKNNLDYKRVHNRIHKLGWDFAKAISTPTIVKKRNKKARKFYG